MAGYKGNDAYLSINGHVIADAAGTDPGIFRSVSFGDFSIDTEDTTGGAGINWKSEGHKLGQIEGEITIMYVVGSVSTDLPGIIGTFGTDESLTMLYGPEGQTVGKPWNDLDIVINNVSRSEQTYDKSLVTYTISFRSTGEPRSFEQFGDTYTI